jgi:hypothetical protein
MDDPKKPHPHESLQSDDGTVVCEDSVNPAGNHISDNNSLCAITTTPCDGLQDTGHAFDEAPLVAAYMPCDTLESVGCTLDHLIIMTNLFDVPPFDFDGASG